MNPKKLYRKNIRTNETIIYIDTEMVSKKEVIRLLKLYAKHLEKKSTRKPHS